MKFLERLGFFNCKHQFYNTGRSVYKCRFCRKIGGLEEQSFRAMSRKEAVCDKSDAWVKNWEWLLGRINCLDRYKNEYKG